MTYITINVLDLIDIVGEDEVKNILSDFYCTKNQEIEAFVKKNAVDFSKRKMSITYLVLDEKAQLAAIFTLTHKAIQISGEGLSNNAKKKIERFARLDTKANEYVISAFLIAQFGKNSNYVSENITGNHLMELTSEALIQAQRLVGGGVVYLECEEVEHLLDFYQNDKNSFGIFDERVSEEDNTKYIQLFKFM